MLTTSDYKEAVYYGHVAFNEEDVWDMIEYYVGERNGGEVKNLLDLLYDFSY